MLCRARGKEEDAGRPEARGLFFLKEARPATRATDAKQRTTARYRQVSTEDAASRTMRIFFPSPPEEAGCLLFLKKAAPGPVSQRGIRNAEGSPKNAGSATQNKREHGRRATADKNSFGSLLFLLFRKDNKNPASFLERSSV